MKTNESRQFEMLARVADFGNSYGHLFPESSIARETFATVAAAVKELRAHAVSKMSTARGGVNQQAKAREALRGALEALSRTARAIATSTPGLDKFEVPADPTDNALLTAGRMFLQDAEPFTAQFIAHAMPQTFLADLAQLADRFEQALRAREAEQNENTAARVSIDAALEAGMAAVRTLDVLVANTLQNDAATTAVWQRDRRVRYRNRAKAVAPIAEPTPATTVAPAAATPPAAAAPTAAPTAGVASTPVTAQDDVKAVA